MRAFSVVSMNEWFDEGPDNVRVAFEQLFKEGCEDVLGGDAICVPTESEGDTYVSICLCELPEVINDDRPSGTIRNTDEVRMWFLLTKE